MRQPTAKMNQGDVSSGPGYQKIFREAVRNGDLFALEKLLEARCDKGVNVNSMDTEGLTAIHQCCIDGNLELVKLLVKFGADTRQTSRDGWSALHIATFGGHQDITLFLLHGHSHR